MEYGGSTPFLDYVGSGLTRKPAHCATMTTET
jgi:hypothetical protein